MLSAYFDPRGRRIRALRDGPGALFEGFAQALFQAGYPPSTARRHLGAAEHFIRSINHNSLSVAELGEQSLTRFVRRLDRCRCRYRHADRMNVLHGARLFLSALRDAGIIATLEEQDAAQDPELVSAFSRWMREQRGTC
jgi:hypothetical protein